MTVISMTLDPKSVRAAVSKLDDWLIGKLEPAAEEIANAAAIAVRDDMYNKAHVQTGRLKTSINNGLTRYASNTYKITASPVDNKGKHYASYERDRGGEHDYARDAVSVGKVAAQEAFATVRSKL